MDLGIACRWAIICASSAGLGYACAEALSAEGVNVVINGRDGARLAAAAEKLRGLGGKVVEVQGDLLGHGRNAALITVPRVTASTAAAQSSSGNGDTMRSAGTAAAPHSRSSAVR